MNYETPFDWQNAPQYRIYPCDQITQGLKNRKNVRVYLWNPLVNKYTKVTKKWAMAQKWEQTQKEYYMTVHQDDGIAFIDTMPRPKSKQGLS